MGWKDSFNQPQGEEQSGGPVPNQQIPIQQPSPDREPERDTCAPNQYPLQKPQESSEQDRSAPDKQYPLQKDEERIAEPSGAVPGQQFPLQPVSDRKEEEGGFCVPDQQMPVDEEPPVINCPVPLDLHCVLYSSNKLGCVTPPGYISGQLIPADLIIEQIAFLLQTNVCNPLVLTCYGELHPQLLSGPDINTLVQSIQSDLCKLITVGNPPGGPAGGDLTGFYPNPQVVWINGYPTYDARYPQLSVLYDNPTWINTLTWSKITDVPPFYPVGPAGGDLTGFYPDPLVLWVNGYPIYDLRYLRTVAHDATMTGTGTSTSPLHVVLPDIPITLPPSGPAGGDLGGMYPNPGVYGIRTKPIPPLAAGFLKYTGTAWIFDPNIYDTGNELITLTLDVTGSGTTIIPATVIWPNGYPTYDQRYVNGVTHVSGNFQTVAGEKRWTNIARFDNAVRVMTIDADCWGNVSSSCNGGGSAAFSAQVYAGTAYGFRAKGATTLGAGIIGYYASSCREAIRVENCSIGYIHTQNTYHSASSGTHYAHMTDITFVPPTYGAAYPGLHHITTLVRCLSPNELVQMGSLTAIHADVQYQGAHPNDAFLPPLINRVHLDNAYGIRISVHSLVKNVVKITGFVTNAYFLYLTDDPTLADTDYYTNVYGIYSPTSKMMHYLNGNLMLGSTSNTTERLQVTGNARFNNRIIANDLPGNVGGGYEVVVRNMSNNMLEVADLDIPNPIPAGATFQTDIDTDISGAKDGVNKVFILRREYVPEKTMIYLNGQRMYRGAGYDYTETAPKEITFNYPINPVDLILADYFVPS